MPAYNAAYPSSSPEIHIVQIELIPLGCSPHVDV